MTETKRVRVNGVSYAAGIFGNPLTGKTNERMRAQIMRKSFDADRFHKLSRRSHGVDPGPKGR